jgi:rhodanese-related sulfurtransferase
MLARFVAAVSLVIGLSFVPAVNAADEKPDTPTSLKGGKVVTVDEAKGMVDKKAAAFFDTRAAINFGKGHIPGASIVAYKEKSEFKADFDASQDSFDLSKLPADKNAKIVFYSDSPQGWKSYKAAVTAVNAGYKNVGWMRDGFAAWTAKALPVE